MLPTGHPKGPGPTMWVEEGVERRILVAVPGRELLGHAPGAQGKENLCLHCFCRFALELFKGGHDLGQINAIAQHLSAGPHGDGPAYGES